MIKHIMSLFVASALVACGVSQGAQEVVITDGFRFNESTTPYDGGLLIPSFGASVLNPLNDEGRGYVSYYKDGVVSTFIEADGVLNAPKGMAVYGDKLIICDVGHIVAYNLADRASQGVVVAFPDGELFVNDIAVVGDVAYISVTNTGNIYRLDLNNISESGLTLAMNVVGANGLLVDGGTMYVASYPASGVTTDDNVVYVVDDIANPVPRKLTERAAQYDGLAKIEGSNYLYVSNWSPAEVLKIDLRSGESEVLPIAEPMVGPADISIVDGYLYIPDLVGSKVIGYRVTE